MFYEIPQTKNRRIVVKLRLLDGSLINPAELNFYQDAYNPNFVTLIDDNKIYISAIGAVGSFMKGDVVGKYKIGNVDYKFRESHTFEISTNIPPTLPNEPHHITINGNIPTYTIYLVDDETRELTARVILNDATDIEPDTIEWLYYGQKLDHTSAHRATIFVTVKSNINRAEDYIWAKVRYNANGKTTQFIGMVKIIYTR